MNLYRNESSDAKYNAQRNLMGRTHYVDDETLRFHKSKILETVQTDNGLLFAIIESCSADWNNTKRVFRPVVFDVFGTIVYRPHFENSFSSRKAASKKLWQVLNDTDAKTITLAGIERAERNHAQEMADLRRKLD